MPDKSTLDARRLLCPMPVIRVQDRVATLSPGDVLEVLATDPGTRSDIPAWCRINGHEMIDIDERDGAIVLTLRVGGERPPAPAREP
jgi:TusA-related sulfurtransferase